MVQKEKITEKEVYFTLENIKTTTSLSEGVEYADLVVEAATEDLDLKLKIFKQIDQLTSDDTILANNTSSI